MTETDISRVGSRREMIRFLDGYSLERREELDERKIKRPLVKTHLIEVLDGRQVRTEGQYSDLFARRGLALKPIDDGLFLVRDQADAPIGFLESLRPRIAALYSTMESDTLSRFVRKLIVSAPELDHVWLSGVTFNVLWNVVARLSAPSRFARIVFTHDSVFEVDDEPEGSEAEEDIFEPQEETEDSASVVERRASSFKLVDRVSVVGAKLRELQKLYSPLYAISQLRFPSPAGRGGHDFYDNGKVTNRSESFRDHRSHVLYVTRIYERMLGRTEQQTWYSVTTSLKTHGEFRKIVGAPLVVRFVEPLNVPTFDHWIKSTFERSRNRFRLWGHPIRLGPTKVHVYGLDRHLWQPLFLELTASGCMAIIPNGTCGNTVHRLVTNIQRFLDPGAQVYLGDQPYAKFVEEASAGVDYEHTE
jgi:hypothetical protein